MNRTIQGTKKVWAVWTNTDLTEGRGYKKILAVCGKKATAIRLGRKKYVQGSDCPITESVAIYFNNQWFIPGEIHLCSIGDDEVQRALDKKEAAIQKAKDAGLSKLDLIDLGIKP